MWISGLQSELQDNQGYRETQSGKGGIPAYYMHVVHKTHVGIEIVTVYKNNLSWALVEHAFNPSTWTEVGVSQ